MNSSFKWTSSLWEREGGERERGGDWEREKERDRAKERDYCVKLNWKEVGIKINLIFKKKKILKTLK